MSALPPPAGSCLSMPGIHLWGARRSGKTSIARVVLQGLPPAEAAFTRPTPPQRPRACASAATIFSPLHYMLWDWPGDYLWEADAGAEAAAAAAAAAAAVASPDGDAASCAPPPSLEGSLSVALCDTGDDGERAAWPPVCGAEPRRADGRRGCERRRRNHICPY